MAIKLVDNFSYNGKKPLDARLIVNTVTDLVALNPNTIYDGILVYSLDTKKFYCYNSNNTIDSKLDKWRELTSASYTITNAIVDAADGSATKGHLILELNDNPENPTRIDCGNVMGLKGDKGDGFAIIKLYTSVSEMTSDLLPVQEGQMVAVVSSSGTSMSAIVYIKNSAQIKDSQGNENGYTYFCNLADATTIQGPRGKDGKVGYTPIATITTVPATDTTPIGKKVSFTFGPGYSIENIGVINDSGSYQSSLQNITPGTIQITDGTNTYTDDGIGNIKNSAGFTIGTVIYTLGIFTFSNVNFTDANIRYNYLNTADYTLYNGLSIKSATVRSADNHLILTLDDNSTKDAGDIFGTLGNDLLKKSEINNLYGLEVLISGTLTGIVKTYNDYKNEFPSTGIISKGTLENVLNNANIGQISNKANNIITMENDGLYATGGGGGTASNEILLGCFDTAPKTFSKGDKYYNTKDKKIYEATSTSAWDTGKTPAVNTIYISSGDKKLYVYDNSKGMIAYGGNTGGGVTISGHISNAIKEISGSDVSSDDGIYVKDLSSDLEKLSKKVNNIDGKGEYVSVDYIDEIYGITEQPIGQIIRMQSNAAPKHYLKTDGSIYNISDYPALAAYIAKEYGKNNYFGGNGATTFAVPKILDDNNSQNIRINNIMTSNTSSGQVASASTSYGGYPPYHAFDSKLGESSYWCSSDKGQNSWLKLDLGSIKIFNKITMEFFAVSNINIQISSDDINYTTIDSANSISSYDKTYDSTYSCRYIKVNIYSQNYCGIFDMFMYMVQSQNNYIKAEPTYFMNLNGVTLNPYFLGEQQIGFNPKGKKLYRTCIKINNWNHGNHINVADLNINKVYNLFAHVSDADNSYNVPYYNGGYSISLCYNIASKVIVLSGDNNTINEGTITIEYTK